MDIPAGPGGADAPVDAPWGINPSTGRPYTKSPEERAAIGQTLAAARQAKAAARRGAAADAAPDPAELPPIDRSAPDRAPGARPPRRRAGRRRGGPTGEPTVKPAEPPFRAGPIAKGMNRIYATIGRIITPSSPVLGQAFIVCSRKESPDDETIGEVWEALAQVNPVWRARLMKLVSGGVGGRVVLAHLPIAMALLSLEPVRKHMPFGRFLEVLLGGDDEPATPDATAEPSFEDMMAMAQQMMGPLMMQRAAAQAGPRTPGFHGPLDDAPDRVYGSGPVPEAAA